MRYVAVKIDMVSSRSLHNESRAAIQSDFIGIAERVNQSYASSIVSKLIVTHGDEAQGMLHTDRHVDIVPILEALVDALRPMKLRFGLGIGTLSTALQETAIGMDGEAWHRAAQAIDTAHRHRKLAQVNGYGEPFDSWTTAVCNLLLQHRSRWTDEQRRIICYRIEGKSQTGIAEMLGIAGPTVSKVLTTAAWKTYTEARSALTSLFDTANALDGDYQALPPQAK